MISGVSHVHAPTPMPPPGPAPQGVNSEAAQPAAEPDVANAIQSEGAAIQATQALLDVFA